jgi:pimeloyl-ACP methyl ester carboxylesterase
MLGDTTARKTIERAGNVDFANTGTWAFVLLHGGQHDGQCWRQVQDLLIAPSTAPNLPHRGTSSSTPPLMSEAVNHICECIERVDADNVILVGHSMAGLIMPAITRRIPNINHAVYISAAAPRPGPDRLDAYLTAEFPWYRIERQILSLWHYFNPNKTINLFSSRPGLRWLSYYFLGLPRSVGASRREVVDTLVPEPNWQLDIDADSAAGGELRTYVAAGRDRIARKYIVNRAIARLGPNIAVHTIPSAGHAVMVSHPHAVATILNEVLASAVRERIQKRA